jgi:alpha-glucosidase (family GH31 glycosyl hydrolase)
LFVTPPPSPLFLSFFFSPVLSQDWTYDPDNFPETEVKTFIDSVHNGGQKFVVIVDPGILAVDPAWPCSAPALGDAGDIGCPYSAFSEGTAANVFVRDGFSSGAGSDGQGYPYTAQVPQFTPNRRTHLHSFKA